MNRVRMTLVFLLLCVGLLSVVNATVPSFLFQPIEENPPTTVLNFPRLPKDLQAVIVVDYLCPKTAVSFYRTCRVAKTLIVSRFERYGRLGLRVQNPNATYGNDCVTEEATATILQENRAFEHCQHISLIKLYDIEMVRRLVGSRDGNVVLSQLNPGRLMSLSLHYSTNLWVHTISGQGIAAFTSLRQLELRNLGWLGLVDSLTALTNLEVLTLRASNVIFEEQSVIGSMTHLKSLDLSHNRIELDRLKGLTGLRQLTLVNSCLGRNNLEHSGLLESLVPIRLASFHAFSQLVDLDISKNWLGDDLVFLSNCPALRYLDMSFNNPVAPSSKCITSLEFLRSLTFLEELICRWNSFDKGWGVLTALEKLPLKKLDLSWSKPDVIAAAPYLTGLTELRSLKLAPTCYDHNPSADGIIVDNVNELLKMTQLQELDLSWNSGGQYDDCVSALKAMPCMRNLTLKALGSCKGRGGGNERGEL